MLSRFRYRIPVSGIVLSNAGIAKHIDLASHLPLMQLEIDFEYGAILLEGEWSFLMACNPNNTHSWKRSRNTRIRIDGCLFPSFLVDLSDINSEGLVFAIEGGSSENGGPSSCSGLLILDSSSNHPNQWRISLFLYDSEFNDCEIKFRLPLFLDAEGNDQN